MQAFWNERYAQADYVYGTQPNVFFREHFSRLTTPGRALFPAEGEGRNAVFAARQGWSVDAFDYSEAARQKAMQLADVHGVELTYHVSTIEAFPFTAGHYDLVGLFFVHVPPAIREALHRQVVQALRPGGYLLLEAFHPGQLQHHSGGPKKADLLYTPELLQNDFKDLTIHYLAHTTDQLDEGAYHQGLAQLTRLVAQKN